MLQIILFSAFAALLGLGLIFAGYALFRILFPIWGFFTGLWLGGAGFAALLGGGFLATGLGLVVGFFVGLVFAVLAYYFYAAAVILFGAMVGYALGSGLMMLIGFSDGFLSWVVGIAAAVVFMIGFVALKLPRGVLIVLTAFAGASILIAGVLALFGQVPVEDLGLSAARSTIDSSWFWWAVWFGLGMLGTVIQTQLVNAATTQSQYSYETFMAEQGKEVPETTEKKEKKED